MVAAPALRSPRKKTAPERGTANVWGADPVPGGQLQQATGDIPVLVVSGELDPVTPPEFADEVAAVRRILTNRIAMMTDADRAPSVDRYWTLIDATMPAEPDITRDTPRHSMDSWSGASAAVCSASIPGCRRR
jgi:hypothetical protein